MDDPSETTAVELTALILVVRSLVIAQALRDAKADPSITPTEAIGYLAQATRATADALLRTIPEGARSQWRETWEGVFQRCFSAPEGLDLDDAFLRSAPPSDARN